MNSMAPPTSAVNVIVGVDTHKHVHVAVAIDDAGQRLGEHRIPVDTVGYQDLERWAKSLGRVTSCGVEGTGSYGVGLASGGIHLEGVVLVRGHATDGPRGASRRSR